MPKRAFSKYLDLLFGLAMARRVVVLPKHRKGDFRVLAFDLADKTVTLEKHSDTLRAGTYSLFWSDLAGHAIVGDTLGHDSAGNPIRALEGMLEGSLEPEVVARISGWLALIPNDLSLACSEVNVGGRLRRLPAYVEQANLESTRWTIHVHGRTALRSETFRGFRAYREQGFRNLAISYRNDGEAGRSLSGTSTLGASEWLDLERAVIWALRQGAKSFVLQGWSMGAVLIAEFLKHSAYAHRVRGLALDSPLIDWNATLLHQTKVAKLSDYRARLGLAAMNNGLLSKLLMLPRPIDTSTLGLVSITTERMPPALILHSEADDYVPIGPSIVLAQRFPEKIALARFEDAGHAKLFNRDPVRWETEIAGFLSRLPKS